eukprot:9046571-Ditylum_brightwellii.AAC.1
MTEKEKSKVRWKSLRMLLCCCCRKIVKRSGRLKCANDWAQGKSNNPTERDAWHKGWMAEDAKQKISVSDKEISKQAQQPTKRKSR